MTQTDSASGDKCHYEVTGAKDEDLVATIHARAISDFWIDAPEGRRKLSLSDIP